ncbi:MAG: RHS repeat-associated core domain-containing protein [Pirellulaceae bacterium]|nr:RHS repeat-associated core domain-containing protein [Pirellulaceae bacterium]
MAAIGTLRTTSSYNNHYTYTGREWDPDLNLYHFRARLYDPIAGRFITRVPLGFVDGMGTYSNYFFISWTDPNGTDIKDALRAGQELYDILSSFGYVCLTENGCTHSCSIDDCLLDVKNLATRFTNALNQGGNNRPIIRWPKQDFGPSIILRKKWGEKYEGYHCYEWSNTYKRMIENFKPKCFKISMAQQKACHKCTTGNEVWGIYVHQWFEVTASCGEKERKFYLDDGFTTGGLFAHKSEETVRCYEPSDECNNGDMLTPYGQCYPPPFYCENNWKNGIPPARPDFNPGRRFIDGSYIDSNGTWRPGHGPKN